MDMNTFKAITDKHHLQIRGIHGEHSESEGGIYDISNKRRLGVTEVECVQDMYDGIVELIAKEKSL
jgi:creatine kinase/arginine kinase